MIETSLMRTLLHVLHLVGEVGLRESILMDEVAITAARRPTGDQVREHIVDATERRLVDCRTGALIGEKRWFITQAGKDALKELS